MSKESKQGNVLPIVVFWVGIGLYQIPVVDIYRDRFQVRPAIAEATELKAKGGGEVSEQILLEHLPDNPRNARLLYSLANFYEYTDRPVLAAFYFHALEHSGRKHDAGPQAVEASRKWLYDDNPAARQLTLDIAQLDKQRAEFERDYRKQVVEHPAELQPVLSVPAANPSVGAGYIPPEFPVACGPDRPRCGYGFDARSGRLWETLPALKLRFQDKRAGARCCELSLEDPDLRSLDVAEADFMMNPELMDGRLASDTEEGRLVRLAFASRVLMKQKLVLDFIGESDNSLPPKPWTVWSWVLLVGWFVGTFLISSWIDDLIGRFKDRRRLHEPSASPPASAARRRSSAIGWSDRFAPGNWQANKAGRMRDNHRLGA